MIRSWVRGTRCGVLGRVRREELRSEGRRSFDRIRELGA